MTKKLIKNRLITLSPGSYLRTAEGEDSFLRINEPAPGLIVSETCESGTGTKFWEVMVNGELINVWEGQVPAPGNHY